METVKLGVRSVQRRSVGQWGLFKGGGVCPMCRCLMERRGAQLAGFERTQSATHRLTAGMQQHTAAYMFKEAAAELGIHEVRKLR